MGSAVACSKECYWCLQSLNAVVLKFFLSRRTLKEFLISRRTGVNVNFLKRNNVFEVRRIATERFFIATTILRYFFFILLTSQDTIQWCFTLQSLLGIPSYKFLVSLDHMTKIRTLFLNYLVKTRTTNSIASYEASASNEIFQRTVILER